MPGMTANVSVLVDQRLDVLKVPSGALRFHPAAARKKTSSAARGENPMAGTLPSSDTSSAKSNSRGFRRPGQTLLWILSPQGKPEPIPVQVGISDGSFTQVISDSLKEGQKIITAEKGAELTPNNNQQVNPFVPRFGGGGRR
jgi:HlyD family secretion protein